MDLRMTRLVVSFNRHYFGLALLACGVGMLLFWWMEQPLVRLGLGVGMGLALYFMVASILAAYVTYDASDLYRMRWWPGRCLPVPPVQGVLLHAGFDPASAALQTRFPTLRLRILDFFDPQRTTETSIQRAHRLQPPTAAEERIAPDAWPVTSASQDAVFILNAAHELRTPGERIAFFREAQRVLRPEGRIIVVEQPRDLLNFACFGVAAFHFFGRRTWLEAFAAANLTVRDEFCISPFLRAFVLQ
jgi:hypothetical protein